MNHRKWNKYFEENSSNILAIENEHYSLTPDERERISASIQSFQLGETSEGHILKKQAQEFCERTGNFDYLEAVKHLIREENRHSAYLGQFMDLHKIKRIKKGLNDTIFRFLRQSLGVEQSIRVLVIAEVIAMTYYNCLGEATESNLLKKICKRMCEEESIHVEFQMQQIHWMNFQKHALASSLSNIAHFFIFFATLIPVWIEHRRVFKVKFTFNQFFQKTKNDFIEATYQGQVAAVDQLVNEGFLKKEALCI